VCRSFKNQERMFLNYNSQTKVELGDVFFWDGWGAKVTLVTSLKKLGVPFSLKSGKTTSDARITSIKGVEVAFDLSGTNQLPTMKVKMKSSSCFALQAYNNVMTSIDTAELAEIIREKIKSGELEWERKWIVVTDLWEADSFTKLIASSSEAEASITTSNTSVLTGFNIADAGLDINLGFAKGIVNQEIANSNAIPYFIGKKFRKIHDRYCMVSYGGYIDDILSPLLG